MVKGVTRRIVEIKETGSNYFERAIFFVKMDEGRNASEYTLSQEARRIIDKYSSGLPLTSVDKKQQMKKRAMLILKYFVSAVAGAVSAILLMHLF